MGVAKRHERGDTGATRGLGEDGARIAGGAGWRVMRNNIRCSLAPGDCIPIPKGPHAGKIVYVSYGHRDGWRRKVELFLADGPRPKVLLYTAEESMAVHQWHAAAKYVGTHALGETPAAAIWKAMADLGAPIAYVALWRKMRAAA